MSLQLIASDERLIADGLCSRAEIIAYRQEQDELITEADFAQMCKRTVRTIRHWRSFGIGPKFIQLDGKVLYRYGDAERWWEQQEATIIVHLPHARPTAGRRGRAQPVSTDRAGQRAGHGISGEP